MIIINYSFKLFITKFGLFFPKYATKYLLFSFIIFLSLPINKIYSNNLCDKLAALEADPQRTSEPILFEDLNPKLVIMNCTSAIKKSRNLDNTSRYYLQRARGHLKIGGIKDAISDLNKSYELGYPAAAFGLATLFYLGDNVTQDFELAKELYFESYNNGVIWAAKGLYFLYSDPNYIKKDQKLANMWRRLFYSSIKEMN